MLPSFTKASARTLSCVYDSEGTLFVPMTSKKVAFANSSFFCSSGFTGVLVLQAANIAAMATKANTFFIDLTLFLVNIIVVRVSYIVILSVAPNSLGLPFCRKSLPMERK